MFTTLGGHLAKRLVEIGVTDVFTVPGDFNLGLLDHIIAEPGLNLVGCCNELNAGYAADGYARSKGVGACIVTFTVGGLSIINAIAGAYSENIPIICLVGAPNSNDYGANKIIHHTLGLFDFNHEVRCFQPITCHQGVVLNLKDGKEVIDKAISTCMEERKPVYLSISCNLPGLSHPTLLQDPIPLSFTPKVTNQKSLEQAVEATSKLLNKASKPVMIIGPNIRVAKIKALDSFLKLADTCGYPIATLPSAKGLITEEHPQYIGTYWGKLSSPLCEEIVESSDAYIYAGPIFDDITTVGDSLLINMDKAIVVQPYCVTVKNGPTFECILMEDFLQTLGAQLQYYTSSAYKNNRNQIYNVSAAVETNGHPHSIFHFSEKPLKVNMLFKHIQGMLSSNTILISEAGDSWFHCQRLKFPQGSGYESQMLYASLGWSIGATLGYAQAAPTKRMITCIGDGAFQMTGQEVSTMLRCEQRSIIFLINNGGYSTEAKIHDGPYTVIKSWNYTGLVDSIYNGEGKCWTSKVTTEKELVSAIEIATGEKEDCLCFIEAIIHKHDTSNELLLLGSRLANANSRPPKE